jgi:MFS family permease
MDDRETEDRRSGFFYGWIIVAAAMSAYVVVSGSTFTLSLFIKPMTEDLSWTRTDVTLGLAIVLIAGSSLGVLTGYLTDRFGPRMIVFAGGIAYATGFFLASRVDQVWEFYASYGLLAAIGMGCMFVPLSSTIARWFVDKRGLAMGLFYAGGGVGGLILTPSIQAVISNWDWRAGWVTLSIVSAALILPAALFLKRDPEDMGLGPLGGSEPGRANAGPTALMGDPVAEAEIGDDHSFGEAIKSGRLWLFGLGCLFTFGGILMAQINLVAYATDRGILAATAATAMGIIAGVNAVGRLGMGAIADRLGIRRTMILTVLLAAGVLFYLNSVDRAWVLLLYAVPFGFLAGGFLTMMPLCLARLFGTSALGSIMGVVGMFAAVGPALSPALGAAIYDRTGSYFYAFLLAGTCAVMALVIFTAILPGSDRSDSPARQRAE